MAKTDDVWQMRFRIPINYVFAFQRELEATWNGAASDFKNLLGTNLGPDDERCAVQALFCLTNRVFRGHRESVINIALIDAD